MKNALMESVSKQGVPATKPKWLNLQGDYKIAFFFYCPWSHCREKGSELLIAEVECRIRTTNSRNREVTSMQNHSFCC